MRNFEEEDEEPTNAIEEQLASKVVESERSSLDSKNTTATTSDEVVINWSDFEIDSQIEFFDRKPLKKIPKKKYKGVKRMVVAINRLDESKLEKNCFEIANSHYCQYFKTRGFSGACSHRAEHISQGVCLNCDFKIDQQDSLKHMAFMSPTVNATKILERPIFTSPTDDKSETEADTTTLKNENETDDDTLVDEESLTESVHSLTTSDISDIRDESISNSSDEELEAKLVREEQRRIKFFEKINAKIIETNDIVEKVLQTEYNDNGIWFCPVETVPTNLDENTKISASDSIICYATDNSKKWVNHDFFFLWSLSFLNFLI